MDGYLGWSSQRTRLPRVEHGLDLHLPFDHIQDLISEIVLQFCYFASHCCLISSNSCSSCPQVHLPTHWVKGRVNNDKHNN